VAGAFQFLQERLDIVVILPGAQAHEKRLHHKRLRGLRIAAGSQALAEQSIDGALERAAGAAYLFLDQAGDVVVEGEGGSHIMMLILKAS
jgi:hypothetical protein